MVAEEFYFSFHVSNNLYIRSSLDSRYSSEVSRAKLLPRSLSKLRSTYCAVLTVETFAQLKGTRFNLKDDLSADAEDFQS